MLGYHSGAGKKKDCIRRSSIQKRERGKGFDGGEEERRRRDEKDTLDRQSQLEMLRVLQRMSENLKPGKKKRRRRKRRDGGDRS